MSSMPYVREDIIEKPACAVSWPAIIGGAVAAAAISLILLVLGSALGLSAISPWSHPDNVVSFTVKTAIWLIVMQWIASGIGGYLTGRLRTRWAGTHSDEVFFRDTVNGFLAWAVATLLMASIFASAGAALVSGGVHSAAMIASAAAGAPNPPPGPRPAPGPHPEPVGGYYVDSLFRSTATTPPAPDARPEAKEILLMGLKNGNVPDADKTYLAQLISARTGITTDEASKRVDDVIAQLTAAKEKAKTDAEEARKTAMHVSVYIFLSLLIGAFIASSSAALGGRHRDDF